MTDYYETKLNVYKKQIPFSNIDRLIQLGTAYIVWSKIDLIDRYFNITVVESSEK